jgi:hypothetical protein
MGAAIGRAGVGGVFGEEVVMNTPGKSKLGPEARYKCSLCKEPLKNEQAVRNHRCRCLLDGHGNPRPLLEPVIERILRLS